MARQSITRRGEISWAFNKEKSQRFFGRIHIKMMQVLQTDSCSTVIR